MSKFVILRKHYDVGETLEFADGQDYEKVDNTGRVWDDWKVKEGQEPVNGSSNAAADSSASATASAPVRIGVNNQRAGDTMKTKMGEGKISAISKDGKFAKLVVKGKRYKVDLSKV